MPAKNIAKRFFPVEINLHGSEDSSLIPIVCVLPALYLNR